MSKIFPACKIVKKAGGLLGIDVTSHYREEFQEALNSFKGETVQLILKRPSKAKTEAQRKAFHSLWRLYFKSGLHSSDSLQRLKIDLKISYGWVEMYESKGKTYEVIVGTENYTREWYSRIIDGTISEMEQSGILGSKYYNEYQEIRQGMGND